MSLAIFNKKGMSTAPTIKDLPDFRKSKEYGGTGKDPVWMMDTDDLGDDLTFVLDKPGHITIYPSRSMSVQDFQEALSKTQDKWRKAPCNA